MPILSKALITRTFKVGFTKPLFMEDFRLILEFLLCNTRT